MPRILATSTGAGPRYTVVGSAVVLRNAEVISTGPAANQPLTAIFGYNSNPNAISPSFDLSVYGTVVGESYGVLVGDTIVSTRIVVGRTGIVAAENAVGIYMTDGASDVRLENSGEIIGRVDYMSYSSTPTTSLFFINNIGSISGEIVSAYGNLRLLNSGTILGNVVGSNVDYITNTGSINGNIYLDVGDDRVINRGAIYGAVFLGAGNDLYDGRHGFVAEVPQNLPFTSSPWVYGNEGNDTFINSILEDNFDGGIGIDTLRFDGSNAAIVFLDGNEGGGSALGDIYLNIENVVGSATGADLINGNIAANTLNGRGGNDVLRGLGGNDQLIGGVGTDTLTGGIGNDAFVFFSVGEGGDRIADFGSVAGNNDVIRISASGFGLSLPAGQLAVTHFRSGTTNQAQDADDRFVLRTTDRTLWFDADGRGGAGPILIADLQDNATFNQTDIVIF